MRRLADICKCRKMHYGDRIVTRNDSFESSSISYVSVLERTPSNGPLITTNKIVKSHGYIATLRKRLTRMRSNVTGPASHQYSRVDIASLPHLAAYDWQNRVK